MDASETKRSDGALRAAHYDLDDGFDDGPLDDGLGSFDLLDSSSNNLRFVGHKKRKPDALGLTRSAGTLNLSLGHEPAPQQPTHRADVVSRPVPTIHDYMDSWSPFKEKPESPATLKRSASKSELSPFVNDPEILRKWMYKRTDEAHRTLAPSPLAPLPTASSATLAAPASVVHPSKHRKTDEHSFTSAKPDQTAFASSGLKSKMRSNLLPQRINPPDTPVKKSPLPRSANTTSIMDSPVHSYSSATGVFASTQTSPLSAAHTRFLSSNLTSDSLPAYKTRKTRASKVLNNTVLTNTLQQFTDDLYGNDDDNDDSFFSERLPSAIPSIRLSMDPVSPLHTPTKAYPLTQQSPFLIAKPKRSINAKISRSASPSFDQFQANPDSHLATKFSNVKSIGSGQFSQVYQIMFPPTNTKYAVKSMRPNKHNSTRRILQEIELLSQISETTLDQEGKEYVLTFISSWKYQGYYYVMTEFCENGNLDIFLQEQVISKNTRLEDWRIWKIIVELSLALRFIHDSCHMVHLDLKPANVLITFEGSLKLGDFGMATKLPLAETGFENEGDREYIAPEIISDGVYDFRADIFSLGLMIVEIAANVVLPDNGNAWHKLRSGDLSDAGRLSSTEIHSDSLFSPTKVNTEATNVFSSGNSKTGLTLQHHDIPAWVPKFLIDGVSLERMVRRLIEPDYTKRPTADEILHAEECEYVEMTRKAGAIIQEDDFGPKPEFFT